MITPTIYRRGAGGIYTQNAPLWLPTIDFYEHTITATGGFESCRFGFTADLDTALFWLDNLMGAIVVTSPDAQTIWEGYLSDVSIQIGQESIGLSIEEMSNAVRVRYQPGIGAQTATAFATDADSIAEYGRKELIYSGSGMTATAATVLRDTLLSALRYPVARRASTVGPPDNTAQVTITGAGWWYTLDWLTTTSTTATPLSTTTQVQNLIAAYNLVNPYFGDTSTYVTDSGVTDTQEIEPNTPYRTKIERLLSLGNSTGARLAYGIYENRALTIKPWAGAGAGATWQTVGLRRNLGTGRLYNMVGGEIWPWDVRPDAIYQVDDFLDDALPLGPDTVSRYYVERVTCSVGPKGATVKLEPAKSTELDVLLARIR